ncbi:MAG: hypothetical protein AB9873_16375 [Syntrophobacteraceae bacterium]
MLNSDILEVAVGVIFIYILTSIVCTVIREGIEGWLKTRAAYLEYGIRELLHDKDAEGIARSFYNHPLIYSLFSNKYEPTKFGKSLSMFSRASNTPSYIPARSFALALMDLAARGPEDAAATSQPSSPVVSLDSIRSNVSKLDNPAVERVLLTAIDAAQGDLNKALASIEVWYDSTMERVSGWYKRSNQRIVFMIGLVVAVALNINTITIADYLYRHQAERAVVVAMAEKAAAAGAVQEKSYEEARKKLDSMGLPIGWSAGWGALRRGDEAANASGKVEAWNDWIAPFLGWLFTALAVTMGAPFWFDVLNKVMSLRSTMKPREKRPNGEAEAPGAQVVQGTGAAAGQAGAAGNTSDTP